jgi:hypothetical protein
MDATQPRQRRSAAGARTLALVVLLLGVGVTLTACGGGATTSPSAAAGASAAGASAAGASAASASATPLSTASGRGTIAFTRYGTRSQDIYVVRSDGRGLRRLAKGARGPAWSPDGRQIAYTTGNGVHVMNADGSGKRLVTRVIATGSEGTVA